MCEWNCTVKMNGAFWKMDGWTACCRIGYSYFQDA